jgi:hypothetical protein
LNDRASDNWRLLLAVADEAGGEWPELARAAAVELSGTNSGEAESLRTLLLTDLRDVFGPSPAAAMSTNDILARLNALEERPWPELNKGKPLSATGLARLLKPYKIRPGTVRTENDTPKGYKSEDLAPVWERYLPQKSSSVGGTEKKAATPPQANKDAGFPQNGAATKDEVWRHENGEKLNGDNGCGGVAAKNPKSAGEEEDDELDLPLGDES